MDVKNYYPDYQLVKYYYDKHSKELSSVVGKITQLYKGATIMYTDEDIYYFYRVGSRFSSQGMSVQQQDYVIVWYIRDYHAEYDVEFIENMKVLQMIHNFKLLFKKVE